MSDHARGIFSRPAARWILAAAIAFLYGFATGRIGAPDDPAVFWIGNLAAPYLVIGFVAGAWAGRKPVAAAAVGAVSVVAAVGGFYNVFGILGATPADEGLAPDAPRWEAVRHSLSRWLSLMLWDSTAPWLTIGVVVGVVAGWLGYRWSVRGSRVGAFGIAAALLAEPVVYLGQFNARVPGLGWAYAVSLHNGVIWGCELLLGVAALVLAARRRRRDATPPAEIEDQPMARSI